MRRILVILAGLGVLQAAAGCQCGHLAGKCDCVPPVHPCSQYGLYAPEPAVPSAHAAVGDTVDAPAPVREKLPAPREGL